MSKKQKLELTWIGKENRPKLGWTNAMRAGCWAMPATRPKASETDS